MTPIVTALHLGKRYQLLTGTRSTFREAVIDAVRAPARLLRRAAARSSESFWALRDADFQICPGEAVGIIGRNGAGKSTLLKILSRITAPSEGEARLRGRVAALLEVGTGFHSELSGRENIYLNGAIMGMKRAEIRARFDEIVAFAEIEQFLDMPIKRYSSGMSVRLAFAVAAHLQPEILVVDEVLAVGDASFQKKCLGKMESVASGGRTVLFVSHNMAAISRLCRRAILLQKGRVVADGPVAGVVASYVGGAIGDSPVSVEYESGGRSPGSEHVRLLAARVAAAALDGATLDIRCPLRIEIDYEVLQQRYPLHPNFHLYNDENACVFISGDSHLAETRWPRPLGRYRATATVPGNFLSEGAYSVDIAISTMDPLIIHACERGALSFHVHDPAEGDSARGTYAGPYPGVVRPLLEWKTEPLVQDAREEIA
jgi:lipopolysaccharide transport system ATP-binding protein